MSEPHSRTEIEFEIGRDRVFAALHVGIGRGRQTIRRIYLDVGWTRGWRALIINGWSVFGKPAQDRPVFMTLGASESVAKPCSPTLHNPPYSSVLRRIGAGRRKPAIPCRTRV